MPKQPRASPRRCPPLRGLQPLTSLSKGLKVLLKLREATEPLSLSEISRALRLNKVTALRLLVTLEKFRFGTLTERLNPKKLKLYPVNISIEKLDPRGFRKFFGVAE
jgi:IclR helix-turn-helix domain